LLQGYRYAGESARSIWDFAVEIQDFKDLGLTSNDLRWMICHEWVEHASEVRGLEEHGRRFEQQRSLSLSPLSCFVLTELGVSVAAQISLGDNTGPRLRSSPDSTGSVSPAIDFAATQEAGRPRWDAERNRLYAGTLLVKEFKLPCPNQGTILMAFEEEHWPARIDDPLPPNGDTDAKTRLSSTIKSLNKYQKNRLIHFMGDGSGEGVRWEFVDRNGSNG
jgi:hypothetical protein